MNIVGRFEGPRFSALGHSSRPIIHVRSVGPDANPYLMLLRSHAMTMEFPVKSASDFAPLKAGDCINAAVFVQDMDYWIAEIEKQSVAAGSCLAVPAP